MKECDEICICILIVIIRWIFLNIYGYWFKEFKVFVDMVFFEDYGDILRDNII